MALESTLTKSLAEPSRGRAAIPLEPCRTPASWPASPAITASTVIWLAYCALVSAVLSLLGL